MVQKQDSHYTGLVSYADELHEKNRKRVRASGILMIILPVVLGLIRWLTDSDKTVFLIIWAFCMFVLSAYLVSIEYMDQKLYKRIIGLTGEEREYDSLVDGEDFVSRGMKRAIRKVDAAEAPAEIEEAEDTAGVEGSETVEPADGTAAGEAEEGGDE